MAAEIGHPALAMAQAGFQREAVPRLDPFTQRSVGDRIFQRVNDGCFFIGQLGALGRLNDRGAVARQVNGQIALSVGQVDFQCVKLGQIILNLPALKDEYAPGLLDQAGNLAARSASVLFRK